jgi:hypothetical protein
MLRLGMYLLPEAKRRSKLGKSVREDYLKRTAANKARKAKKSL